MKKILYCLISFIMFISCTKTEGILFCEGVSPEGEGVNCGKKFETGDLTALIKNQNPLEVSSIDIIIYEVINNKTKKIETIIVKVKPDGTNITATLSIYNKGIYRVTAVKKGEEFAKADLEIVDY